MIKRVLDSVVRDKLFKGKAIIIMGPRQVVRLRCLKSCQ